MTDNYSLIVNQEGHHPGARNYMGIAGIYLGSGIRALLVLYPPGNMSHYFCQRKPKTFTVKNSY